MNTPQPKQRWHYKDPYQEMIIEIVTKRNDLLYGRIVQIIKNSFRQVGQTDPWSFEYGTWVYLEGQDAL
jgi:hypothetical protein